MGNSLLNINETVRVRLTPHGRAILAGVYSEPRSEDEDGYAAFQLHELMRIFGQYMHNGAELCFAPDILIGREALRALEQEAGDA